MQPDPKTTHMLWCDFNSRTDEEAEKYSTLADKTHDGLPLDNGLQVFLFDYDDFDIPEIVGVNATIEDYVFGTGIKLKRARVDLSQGTWSGPLPQGFCKAKDDTDWYYKNFPTCED
ncbi:MAG: hypothetical protein ABIQ44_00795 [Chloroflexia bacterium]